MKIKQKIISVLLAAACTISMCNTAIFAADINDVSFDLRSLGIMVGDDDGDLHLDDQITRAEFATVVVNLINKTDMLSIVSDRHTFTDVPENHWAKNYIELLTSLNIITGTSPTTFAPEENISLAGACTILVNALGYSEVAKSGGGYPTGYVRQASSIGLFKGVNTGIDPLTRREVAVMLYNALDVNIMSLSYSADGSAIYEVQQGDTYRSQLLDRGISYGNLVKMEGIVTATVEGYMLTPYSDMEDTQVEISGKLYTIQDTSIQQCLGMKVNFYIEDEDSSVIISYTPTSDNTVNTFDAELFKSASGGKLTYYKVKNQTATGYYNYEDDAVLLYNLRPVENWSEDTLKAINKGEIRLIDNDKDNRAEVIIAMEYESVVIDSAAPEQSMLYFKDGYTLLGQKYINLDPEDSVNSDRTITIENTEGGAVDLSSVTEGNILSAYVSLDETLVKLILSQDTAEGIYRGMDTEDGVLIDEEYYDAETPDKEYSVSLGDSVIAYLNFNGEIVDMKQFSSEKQYGYIITVVEDNDIGSSMARIIIPAALSERTLVIENEDGGENTTQAKLACKNSDIKYIALAEKVNINGTRVSEYSDFLSLLEGQVVSYSLNNNNEINMIKTPEAIGKFGLKTYNSYERTFGKTSTGCFGVSTDTMTICIPTNDSPSHDDYLVGVEMTNGKEYTVCGYDKNDATYMADLIVVQASMKSGSLGIINTSSDIGFINKYIETIDENGDKIYTAEVLTEEGTFTYHLADILIDLSRNTELASHQLIAYSLDATDKIDNFEVIKNVSAGMAVGNPNAYGDNEALVGYAVDMRHNIVSQNLNRWVSELDCSITTPTGANARTFEVTKNNTPPIFIYKTDNSKASLGDLRQIRLGSDKIIVVAANDTVRAIVAVQ